MLAVADFCVQVIVPELYDVIALYTVTRVHL